MPKTLIEGYDAAAEATGLSRWQLMRMVAKRQIRVIKRHEKIVMFDPEHLLEDIEEMHIEIPKIS